MKGYQFTKRELQSMDTIEQSWSGDELKIQNENVRVWLTHRENRTYDGDYQIEINVDGRWVCESFNFEY
jgi:hypothetical protein